MMKISIVSVTALLLFSLFASNIISLKDGMALSFNFGGPNGFNFDTDSSSAGDQGPKGDKGDTGAKGDTGDQGPKGDSGQGIEYGFLNVITNMIIITTRGLEANADDYTVRVDGNHQTPDTFPGSEEGINVTLGFGSYSVTQTPNNNLIGQYSHITYGEGCSGVIHPGEIKLV